jgi:acyl-CoA reductase-like NAD-dependent aldehyde dehydrogenase
MAAAQAAFSDWATKPQARRAMMHGAADRVEHFVEELSELITLEQGRPLRDARGECAMLAAGLRYFADLELSSEILTASGGGVVELQRRPMGPIAVITPWNGPLSMFAMKVPAVLAAGNTAVVKPSNFTPLSTLRLGEILLDVFPPGVLNVVSGKNDQLGILMTEHPVPRKVTLTGSVETGKLVAASTASDLKRLTLELGGNDPAIVMDDAVVSEIADSLFWGAFRNCGQFCAAVKRIYVPRSMEEELLDRFAAIARSVVVGDGLDPMTQIGPINNEPQLRRVESLRDDAVARGGRMVFGGSRMARPGFFFEPTVVANLPDEARLVMEEQFGPILPVLPYDSLDEAISRANDTRFGLGASVWTGDATRGALVADMLEAGMTWVNAHGLIGFPVEPMSGAKWSGLGVESGVWGMLGSTELRIAHRAAPQQ